GTWAPGGGGEVVALRLRDDRMLRVAPLICYDALAPALAWRAVRDGAEMIVTLSNDAWFAGGPAPWLHLVGAAFRSIETRRPPVRATHPGSPPRVDASGALLPRQDFRP